MQIYHVKWLVRITAGLLSFGPLVFPARAAFTSLYVFGDTVSSTTSNVLSYPESTFYYGQRFSNGRAWVEVLAQRQGLLPA